MTTPINDQLWSSWCGGISVDFLLNILLLFFFALLKTGIQADDVDQGQECLGVFPLLAEGNPLHVEMRVCVHEPLHIAFPPAHSFQEGQPL